MKKMFSCSSHEVAIESWNKHDQKLFDAVEKGDVTRTSLFASRKTAHPTKLNALGQSAFHLAASKGLTECLTILLTHGADVNDKNEDGSTALHLATIACQPQCVKVLLQHGADEDCVDGESRTPLHWAALSGCASSVLLLCDQEAFLDVTDKNDRTPLMIAAQGNQTAICSQLLQRGAKVDLPDKDGKTALILACENGGAEAADLLLQNGANVALMDKTDHDALYYATRSKNRILRRQIRTALKRWKKRELGLFDSSETGSQVPSESGKDTDVSSLAFQSEAGDQSDDEGEAEEGSELREWQSRFREEKMKVIQLELQLDQKTKECQVFSKGCQLLKEKVWDQVQEIGQLLPDREGRVRDWRQLSRHLGHDHTEGDHCLDLLAQQVRDLKERKKQQEAEKELAKASTQGGMTSPTKLQPAGTVRWPGEEEAEELKHLRNELQAALEEKATAVRRVEEMEGHMENMRAVIGVFEAKKKSQNAALKEMEGRTQQLGDENRRLRGLLGKHLAGPPETSLAQAKVAQCIKEMEETQFRAREEMVAMLAENEDLKKEAEEAVRSRLQFQAVPSGAVKKCVTAWKKVVTGWGALANLEQACSALVDKARPLQEAILEPPSKTLVNGNGLPEEEKNGSSHEPARLETVKELQKDGVEKTQVHNGLVGQVKLRPKPEGVENKARPCHRRSSDMEKEVWDLKQNNGGLVQELAQLSREREKLQEELQKLHGSTEGSPRAEKTERLVEELKRTVEVLSQDLSLEKEESGKLRLKLEEQRKEVMFVRNNFLKKVNQDASGIIGDNLDSCILKELHWKLDNVVRKQNEALQLVSEMEEENRALEADRTLLLDPRSPDDDKTGQEIFLEASEVIGENWKVREQMVELEKGLQEMKKLLVASQVTQGGLKAASLMQLLDRVLAQMADLRREEEQVLGKYEKICSMLSTRAQVLGEELAALREKYEEARGASTRHKEALDRELRKTQELMAEALEHEEEVEELRGKSQKLEGNVDKLNKKVDDIAKMCQERDAKIKKLLKETEKLSSEILNLRSERTRLILQNEVAQKNHQEIVAIYRTHLLNAAQGYMDEEVHAMLLRILRTD
ncbi:LOW QUALITY PROTEIN: ankyrin repeat domain-containing protein 35 [Pantherophis guttatus]|uniref:LOW QUALITY PROTEIN: ankyrin repeat domain-containing protein 35 n=1 Tax=Pantherophis guttatus TaxID=94885 RepID=A0ABM3YR17_PANGU|nr:LOW QUALITY PROTEIN: ankyrin repeat domain-containing protein 35 [Pantherophis guttatus]